MQASVNLYLLLGGLLSFLASLAHIGIIFGGAKWYRFFGAGEKFAKAAEQGKAFPGVMTFCIALVLASWGIFAWSGAGLVSRVPLVKAALCVITGVYLLRGLGGFGMLLVESEYTGRFIVVSSLICVFYGLVHLIGLVQMWPLL
jgi:hypothetical protein